MKNHQFHPDFLEKTFALNDAAILSALLPVAADLVGGTEGSKDAFEAALREYVSLYAQHLAALDDREFVVAMKSAAEMLAARGNVDVGE